MIGEPVSLSAVVITFNEERCIERCIRSLIPVADEILVLDSHSTDKTEDLCKNLGVRFIQHAFDGYIEQKNRVWSMANGTHVISLDADETLSEQLIASIKAEKQKGFPHQAYDMNRMTSIGNQWIRHGSWYPDTKLRLAKKEVAKWGGINPHDQLIAEKKIKTFHLKGDILHYSFADIQAFKTQGDRFTTIAAQALYHSGKKSSFFKVIFSPVIAFLKSYFFKLGFMDGMYGFVIANEIARQTKMKYQKLMNLHINRSVSGRSDANT